jgi:hypothetical protein
MEDMESLESSQVGDAREIFAAINPHKEPYVASRNDGQSKSSNRGKVTIL